MKISWGDAFAASIFAALAAAGIGWIMNVAKMFTAFAAGEPMMFLARLLTTIFFPLGCITGWM